MADAPNRLRTARGERPRYDCKADRWKSGHTHKKYALCAWRFASNRSRLEISAAPRLRHLRRLRAREGRRFLRLHGPLGNSRCHDPSPPARSENGSVCKGVPVGSSHLENAPDLFASCFVRRYCYSLRRIRASILQRVGLNRFRTMLSTTRLFISMGNACSCGASCPKSWSATLFWAGSGQPSSLDSERLGPSLRTERPAS